MPLLIPVCASCFRPLSSSTEPPSDGVLRPFPQRFVEYVALPAGRSVPLSCSSLRPSAASAERESLTARQTSIAGHMPPFAWSVTNFVVVQDAAPVVVLADAGFVAEWVVPYAVVVPH